jgi:small subunit ribosomal protein S1
VDLDGIDGLIHISELSWSHVTHPSEVVSIGDTVKIKVLDIDRDRQRISLGLKQTQDDPWQRVVSTYGPGNVLEGTVTKVVDFGAFVEVLDGVEGLVHISELADHHVENPREVVDVGAKLNVKILEIDEDRRRLSLSIKRVEDQNMLLKDLGAAIEAASGADTADTAETVDASEEAEVEQEAEAAEVVEDVAGEAEVESAENAEIEAEEEAVAEVDDEAASEEESADATDAGEQPEEGDSPS